MRAAWGSRDEPRLLDESEYDARTGTLLPSARSSTVPWKAVALAVFLTAAGLSLFIAGLAVHSGRLTMLCLGALLLIPGSYHCVLAYRAYRKVPGYTFDSLPEV